MVSLKFHAFSKKDARASRPKLSTNLDVKVVLKLNVRRFCGILPDGLVAERLKAWSIHSLLRRRSVEAVGMRMRFGKNREMRKRSVQSWCCSRQWREAQIMRDEMMVI